MYTDHVALSAPGERKAAAGFFYFNFFLVALQTCTMQIGIPAIPAPTLSRESLPGQETLSFVADW